MRQRMENARVSQSSYRLAATEMSHSQSRTCSDCLVRFPGDFSSVRQYCERSISCRIPEEVHNKIDCRTHTNFGRWDLLHLLVMTEQLSQFSALVVSLQDAQSRTAQFVSKLAEQLFQLLQVDSLRTLIFGAAILRAASTKMLGGPVKRADCAGSDSHSLVSFQGVNATVLHCSLCSQVHNSLHFPSTYS